MRQAKDRKDLEGKKFGRLIVKKYIPAANYRAPRILTQCDCGTIKEVQYYSVVAGIVRSCGCLQKDRQRETNTTHGLSSSSEYSIWNHMRARCSRPTHQSYARYGGRGICVCERWQSFKNFFADMGPRPDGLTLERIDNDGHYSPENCRWATRKEQSANTSQTHFIERDGKRMHVTDWARELGVAPSTVFHRMARDGASAALARPKGVHGKLHECFGNLLTVRHAAEKHGVNVNSLHSLLQRGRTIEEAITRLQSLKEAI